MIYLCGCGQFHNNYPCVLCDDCLETSDGQLWEKLTPKNISYEDDVAIASDSEHYSCWYCGWSACSCEVDISLLGHETNEHLEQT